MTKFLVCHMCGRNFGSASLSIHQKACAQKSQPSSAKSTKKRATRPIDTGNIIPMAVDDDNSSGNLIQSAVDNLQVQNDKMKQAYDAMINGQISLDEFNRVSLDSYENNSVQRGVKFDCKNCHRTFARKEGLDKHQILCERQGKDGGNVFARKSDKKGSDESIASSQANVQKSVTMPMKKRAPINTGKSKKSVPSTPLDIVGMKRLNTSSTTNSTFMEAVISFSPSQTMRPFNFCNECGSNFATMAEASSWKFCPCCGTKRITIAQ